MSFSIQYRPLVDLSVRHDYYLNQASEGSFYGLDPAEDNTLIQSLLASQAKNEDLSFEPLPGTQSFLKGHKMVFRSDPSGLKVYIAVKSIIDQDGATLFHPVIDLSDSFSLFFKIKVNNPSFWNFTNINLLPGLSSIYYFNNIEGDKTYPSLATQPASFDNNRERKYEMGELTSSNNGDVYQALQRTDKALNSSTSWKKITDNQYINGNDRRLIPIRESSVYNSATEAYERIQLISCHYFPVSDLEATQLTFRLEDENGVVDTLETDRIERKMTLQMKVQGEGPHQLTIEGDDGFSEAFSILCLQRPFENLPIRALNTTFGIIEIRHEAGMGDFRLLEDEGHLKVSGNGANKKLDVASFQLRFKNRSTYWEYILAEGDEPADAGDLKKSTEKENAVVTTSAQPLQQSRIEVDYNVPNGLPNPSVARIQPRADGRTYSEIYLPKLT